eukprot:12936938-Alexandrium_andersonii.AAC.1
MSASLVGSEMCIRDSIFNGVAEKYLDIRFAEAPGAGGKGRGQPPDLHLRPAAAACLDPELGATS